MEIIGKNLKYIVNEAQKAYSKHFNKWLIDTMEKNKLKPFDVTLTVYNCPGISKVDYKLIENKTGAIYSILQMETKTVGRDK